MVLETLLSPKKAERKPWEMFFIGILYSSVALFLSLWIFPDYTSISVVVLTTFAAIPLIHGAIKLEEKKDVKIKGERNLLREHSKALCFFMFLFLGCVVSFSIWYMVLPSDTVDDVFSVQQSTIINVNEQITGNAISESNIVSSIFFKNLKVLFFALIFSFFFGAGAIYILTWNASIIGVAIGFFTKSGAGNYSLALARYLIHGIPEMFSYFIVGLAGGIISISIIRHDFMSKKFKNILFDSTSLILIGVFILFLAALIEVYVTPIFF